MSNIKYIVDKLGHFICVPYSIENLHLAANRLCIDSSLFRVNHYFIGNYSEEIIKDIKKHCKQVSFDNIVEIIRSPEYAEIIISDNISGGCGNGNSHKFEATQIEIKGQNLNYE